jgi:hypothetical protein
MNQDNQNELLTLTEVADLGCLRGRQVHCVEREPNSRDWCVSCKAKFILMVEPESERHIMFRCPRCDQVYEAVIRDNPLVKDGLAIIPRCRLRSAVDQLGFEDGAQLTIGYLQAQLGMTKPFSEVRENVGRRQVNYEHSGSDLYRAGVEAAAKACDDLRANRPTTERGRLIAEECAIAVLLFLLTANKSQIAVDR